MKATTLITKKLLTRRQRRGLMSTDNPVHLAVTVSNDLNRLFNRFKPAVVHDSRYGDLNYCEAIYAVIGDGDEGYNMDWQDYVRCTARELQRRNEIASYVSVELWFNKNIPETCEGAANGLLRQYFREAGLKVEYGKGEGNGERALIAVIDCH